MKKGALLFFVAFALLLILGLIFKQFISASIFDTWATFSTTSPNITIDAHPPDLIVDSPISTNYSTTNISIDYSVSDSFSEVDTVWYNLDGGSNMTLTSNTTITPSRGDHNFFIYANDSVNLINDIESVIFSVIAERTVKVNFSQFDSPTTNFSDLNDSELENIENLTLEIGSYGKIVFSENINISSNTDLDTYIDISSNSIYINSDALLNFNKPATLQLYGLTFTNPRVLKDGSVCPANVCNEVSYSGGVFEFTVTGFSNYSSEETPVVSPIAGAVRGAEGGGGGLAGKKVLQTGFDVDIDMIRLQLKRGESLKKSVNVENTGETPLTVTLSIEKLGSFIFIPEKSFMLNPGEAREVSLDFVSSGLPDVYTGRVVLVSEGIQKFIPIILEVESEKVLYDITLDIPAKYTKLTTEREIPLIVTIFNIAGPKTAEVEVEYLIITGTNGDAEVVAKEKETVTINEQASFTKTLKLPNESPYGEYLAVAKVRYGESVGTSSRVFEIAKLVEEPSLASRIMTKNFVMISIVVILVLSIIIIGSSHINRKKLKHIEKTQVKRLTQLYTKYEQTKNTQEKKEKAQSLLERERALLDQAFRQRYISKDAYQKGKLRIESIRKKIK